MTRKKKLLLNSTSSLAYEIVAVVCGFILPRVLLSHFGSRVNGLVASITQFLSLISLCELGIGAVVRSALYEPLALGDDVGVSKIAISSDRFFRKMAMILFVYVIVMMVVYPLIVIEEFSYTYTMLLILAISISTFAQYYFGITNRLILSADQLSFVYSIVHTVVLILNTVSCVILVSFGAGIHIVKLTTSLLFLLQPLACNLVAKRRYRIDRTIKLTEEPLKQKWSGMAQHLATVVLNNTPTLTLTLFTNLESVSVYSVYHIVVNGVRQVVVALTNGIQALLGNMLAKKEMEQLDKTFDMVEWVFHTLVTIVFTITGLTILPFIRIYTNNITDVNYNLPLLAVLSTLAQATYCLRLPYNMMVLAAGHFKQTQASAIIEMVLNIGVSVVMTLAFGLIGVAIGMVTAMVYRTVYFALYLKENILFRDIKYFVKNLIVDLMCMAIPVAVVCCFPKFYALGSINYFAWGILAVKVGITCLLTTVVVNWLLNRSKIQNILKKVKKGKRVS